jgi:excisionase family DNA binding protein
MAGLASAMPLDPPPEEHMLPAEMIAESGLEPRIGRSVSLDHAAQLLGVSRRTIYNRIREGRLQTIRTLGGSQRVLIDSVHDVRSTAAILAARS